MVTVLILTYNDRELVRRAIDSVLQQSYRDFKIRILDNGSTDGTAASLSDYLSDPRVTLVQNLKNQRSEFGVREAFKVDTKYLSFLFSDDVYAPDRLQKMVDALESQPSGAAVFANNEFQNQHGEPLASPPVTSFGNDITRLSIDEHLGHFLTKGNSLHPCAMLIRAQDYRELGGFKPYLHRIGDMTFFACLLSSRTVLLLPDRLQRISIFTTGRNESFANTANPMSVAFERSEFLAAYKNPQVLARLEKIIPELAPKVSAEPASRLFWLGHWLFQIPTLDHQVFAYGCLTEAYALAPQLIDKVCEDNFGRSFAQYMHGLTNSAMAERAARTTAFYWIRRQLLRLPGGRAVVALAQKLRGR